MLGKASEIKTARVIEGQNGFEYTLNKKLNAIGDVEVLQIQTHIHTDQSYPDYQFMQALIIYKEAKEDE